MLTEVVMRFLLFKFKQVFGNREDWRGVKTKKKLYRESKNWEEKLTCS